MAGAAKKSASKASKAPGGPRKYREIHVVRSDGIFYTADEINQAIRKKDKEKKEMAVSDVKDEDNEHVRAWKIKLGMTIKYNLGLNDDEDPTDYYVHFPEGYQLRTRPYASRNRNDPVVFGHPVGAEARFRSPAELAQHIIWLMSSSPSPADCSCKLCKQMTGETTESKKYSTVAPAASSSTSTGTKPQPPTSFTSVGNNNSGTASTAPRPAASANHWSPGSSEVFRAGELVWYHQSAWRLGVIQQVTPHESDFHLHQYRISPLGHTFLKLQDVTKTFSLMRPFLSFSVPGPHHDVTSLFENKTFDEIDWTQLASSSPDQQIIGLEASKLAARKINGSFSLFNKMQSISATQVIFGGVFLGAEQIRVNDAIRVNSGDVMSVRSIYSNGNNVNFVGHIYRMAQPTTGSVVGEQPTGQTFVEEMQVRSEITGQRWYWELRDKDQVFKESDVHGRFYVTNRLMENLKPDQFQAERAQGRILEGLSSLNNRLQSTSGAPQYMGRKPTRQATIGAAISTPLALGDGIVEEAVTA